MRHVTIFGLMTFVLVCGVGTAALHASTEMWAGIAFSSTLLILTSSILLAIYGHRPFWLGFAVFGWIYLGASLIPSVEARLLSKKGLAWLHANTMELQFKPVAFSPDGRILAETGTSEIRLWDMATGKPMPPIGSFSNFLRIGHSLLALLAGLLGGFMATWLHDRSARHTSGSMREES